MVTGPSARAAARSAGSSDSIRPVTAARPASTACHCAADPPGQARRGRGRQPRHGRQLLARRIGALAVQPGQEILARQLRRSQPRQQLPGPEPAFALLDRADRRIQRPDHAKPVTQLGDSRQARVRRQRRIRRADPRLLPRSARPAAYPFHQVGASPLEMIITSQRSSSQVKGAPIGICAAVSPTYSRIRVRQGEQAVHASEVLARASGGHIGRHGDQASQLKGCRSTHPAKTVLPVPVHASEVAGWSGSCVAPLP